MTLSHQAYEARHRRSTTDVEAWRRCRLVEAGFPAGLAASVTADPRLDLHVLLQLVDQGCPPDLAARIVSPLAVDVTP